MVDVERGAEQVERAFEALDGHVHPRAEASGVGQDDLHRAFDLRRELPLASADPYPKRIVAAGEGGPPCGLAPGLLRSAPVREEGRRGWRSAKPIERRGGRRPRSSRSSPGDIRRPRFQDGRPVVLVGIRTRGVPMAERIAARLAPGRPEPSPVGARGHHALSRRLRQGRSLARAARGPRSRSRSTGPRWSSSMTSSTPGGRSGPR